MKLQKILVTLINLKSFFSLLYIVLNFYILIKYSLSHVQIFVIIKPEMKIIYDLGDRIKNIIGVDMEIVCTNLLRVTLFIIY